MVIDHEIMGMGQFKVAMRMAVGFRPFITRMGVLVVFVMRMLMVMGLGGVFVL